jgi:hypothetical protein
MLTCVYVCMCQVATYSLSGVHFLSDLIGNSDSETMKIEEHACTRSSVGRVTHSVTVSVKLRSGYRKQTPV